MDYCEGPAGICEHLNFPAHFVLNDMLLRKIKQSFKKSLGKSSDILRRPQKFGPSFNHNLSLLSSAKKEWKMGQMFLAFSEYLNFNYAQSVLIRNDPIRNTGDI